MLDPPLSVIETRESAAAEADDRDERSVCSCDGCI